MRFEIFSFSGDMKPYRDLLNEYNAEWTDRGIYLEIETLEQFDRLALDFKSFEAPEEYDVWNNPDLVICYPEPKDKNRTPQIYIYDFYNE